MKCAASRDSEEYVAVHNDLKLRGMTYPYGKAALVGQTFPVFVTGFEVAYCLDACLPCRKTYEGLLSQKNPTESLHAMHSSGWRVMDWFGERIRIVNLNTLK